MFRSFSALSFKNKLLTVLCILLISFLFTAEIRSISAVSEPKLYVEQILAPQSRDFYFPVGVSKESLGLPAKLTMRLSMQSNRFAAANTWEQSDYVEWVGRYSPVPGEYWFEAKPSSPNYVFSSICPYRPAVRVIVSEHTYISDVEAPFIRNYTVPYGADDVTVLETLPAFVKTNFATRKNDADAYRNSVGEPVTWVCDSFNSKYPGTYTFTAVFNDPGLVYKNMPTIEVTVLK